MTQAEKDQEKRIAQQEAKKENIDRLKKTEQGKIIRK